MMKTMLSMIHRRRSCLAAPLLRMILRGIYAIQQFFVKAVEKFTGAAFPTSASKPEETGMPFYIVAECTVTAVASIVKHVTTDGGCRHGRIYNVLGEIKIGISHETRRRRCFLGEFLVHGKENLHTRIYLLLKINIVGAIANFVCFINRAGNCCHGCACIGRSSRSRYCFFTFYAILSWPSRPKKGRS
jgi:hypothetical protein